MRTQLLRIGFLFLLPFMVVACTASGDGEGLQSALVVQQKKPQPYKFENSAVQPQSAQAQPDTNQLASAQGTAQPSSYGPVSGTDIAGQALPAPATNGTVQGTVRAEAQPLQPGSSFAAYKPEIAPLPPRESRTFLINGLASNVKAIGYGFTNLAKKISNSELYNYASFIESSTVIRSRITKQMKAIYRRNPNIEFNLIGVSFGANIVTLIAADLDKLGIPVNYLVTIDGPAMVPIRDNVAVADNFTCSNLDCFRTKSRLARGNRVTSFASFKIPTSHIPLPDHRSVHARILSQLKASRRAYRYSASTR
jgi:hypothetical protein